MTTTMQRDELQALAERLLKQSEAAETEIVITTGESYLTRFARNQIHQNVGSRTAGVTIRTITDKRIGLAEAETLDEDALRLTLAESQQVAAHRPPQQDFPGLPKPRRSRPINAYDQATASASPEQRAELVAALAAEATKRDAEAAGMMQTSAGDILVANSRGLRAYHRSTQATFQSVVTCGDGSGYAEHSSTSLKKLNSRNVISQSVALARRSRRPKPLAAGEYDVVLSPEAVSSLVSMMAHLGFGAKNYQQGKSFMCNRIGQQVTGEKITILDDARHRLQHGMPFDFEGQPRQKLTLIENGIAQGIAYDSLLAARENPPTASTGHALPARMSGIGPLPINLVMLGGHATMAGLIKSMRRGLLVTRFHYVNVSEPQRVVLTGMTRDGTFWVEDGRIRHAVRNLRFTESALDALSRVTGLTNRLHRANGGTVCPGAAIEAFRFTGSTDF